MVDLKSSEAVVMAGIPGVNAALYRKIRFSVFDPVAYIELGKTGETPSSVLILRDIEMERARAGARADLIACPADYTPEGGLSGDRETATAQATAECLRRAGVKRVIGDRTLPLIYAEMIGRLDIKVECDLDMGVTERRSKDAEEIAFIREAQGVTEEAVKMACGVIANAEADADGVLRHEGAVLTAERVQAMVDIFFIEHGYTNPGAIIAGGKEGGDCHNVGSGPLRTGEPVIVDIFPQNAATHYCGDCTRTVVHGVVPDSIAKMHAAVVEAKAAGIAAIRPGVTGEEVHVATAAVIKKHGYNVGLPAEDAPDTYCAMTHGTGHGVGLDVHEPPLLDFKGPELLLGEVITIEPGVYSKALGGVRVEDVVVVTEDGGESLNRLPEGLDWRSS